MTNIFVIHNIHNIQRKESFLQEMAYQGLQQKDYTIMPAVMHRGKACTGISRSHKKCVQIAKEKNMPYVIIIEDDIMFLHKESLIKFQKYRSELPPDWEIYLGGIYDGTPIPIGEHIAQVQDKISGMHLYMVHQGFYDKFLQADEAANIDWWLSTEAKAKMYLSYPMLGLQHEFYSDNAKNISTYNYGIEKRYKLINEILK